MLKKIKINKENITEKVDDFKETLKFMAQICKTVEMARNKEKREEFNDEMYQKTAHYQDVYNFESNSQDGHKFWNDEGDAFKHTFGSAVMSFRLGNLGSLAGGTYHELFLPNNPENEWNMDSWNNRQGREIAKEIELQYGKSFSKFPQQKQEDIIAEKVMTRMKKGLLITSPTDKREFNGKIEKYGKNLRKKFDNKNTRLESNSKKNHIFTAEEIGKMNTNEFLKNESKIMNQLKMGLIKNNNLKKDYSKYVNPVSKNRHIYTREELDKMTTYEFSKNEKVIMQQLKDVGIPYKTEIKSSYGNKLL